MSGASPLPNSALCANVSFLIKVGRVGDMELNWKKLSNKQKTIRTVVVGSLVIVASVMWFDDILQWHRGTGALFLATAFVGIPL